jgi:hypothetical protein
MHTGGRAGERGRRASHVPPIKIFEKLHHKNAIKHDPPDFLTTPSNPHKRICQKKTPGFPTTVHLWSDRAGHTANPILIKLYLFKCLDIKKLYFQVQAERQIHGCIPEPKKATQEKVLCYATFKPPLLFKAGLLQKNYHKVLRTFRPSKSKSLPGQS